MLNCFHNRQQQKTEDKVIPICLSCLGRWHTHTQKKGQTACLIKGTQMGPQLVLVSPSFRENIIVTCKIVSFLCSLDYFILKNVIVFFFKNHISKWRSFEKSAVFDLLFTFLSHQGKVTKIPSAHISHTYTYFAQPKDFFILTNFAKIWIYYVWFLFGVDSFSCHFGAISK